MSYQIRRASSYPVHAARIVSCSGREIADAQAEISARSPKEVVNSLYFYELTIECR